MKNILSFYKDRIEKSVDKRKYSVLSLYNINDKMVMAGVNSEALGYYMVYAMIEAEGDENKAVSVALSVATNGEYHE